MTRLAKRTDLTVRGLNNLAWTVHMAQVPEGYGFAESLARRLDLPAIRLYTNVKMTENLPFYESLGFLEVERRREDGFDRVYFSRSLA